MPECSLTKRWLIVVLGAFLVIGVVVTLVGFMLWGGWQKVDLPNPMIPGPPSPSPLGVYDSYAVSCDAPLCADIGKKILQRNGTVADAAIATLVCMGVVHAQSLGIGGGFLLVLFNATTNSSMVLNARETAPSASTVDMFNGDKDKAQTGALSVAVPGELKGYWELYKKAGGGVPWRDLFHDSIKLCEEGFSVSSHAYKALKRSRNDILNEPTMKIFLNPKTRDIWNEGDHIKRPDLAKTLRRIANSPLGGDELYTGELAKLFVDDLTRMGGIITLEDMANYRAEWEDSVQVDLYSGIRLHTVPPPGSGVLMAFMMNVMSQFKPSPEDLKTVNSTIRTYGRIAEAFKYAYAKRTELGDPSDPSVKAIIHQLVANLTSPSYGAFIKEQIQDGITNNSWQYYGAEFYQPEDHGTAHLSILASNGDSISVTSTVNLYFGARIRSSRTGIIYNDEMDDFSAPKITNYFGVPPSPNNFIKPGKRPLSSMSPAIFSDSLGKVRLSVGTAGGTKITSATALVSMRYLWFNETLKEAIDAPRFHHQLYPMELQFEYGTLDQHVQGFQGSGHKVVQFDMGQSVTCAVGRDGSGHIVANSDFRKSGSIAGI